MRSSIAIQSTTVLRTDLATPHGLKYTLYHASTPDVVPSHLVTPIFPAPHANLLSYVRIL